MKALQGPFRSKRVRFVVKSFCEALAVERRILLQIMGWSDKAGIISPLGNGARSITSDS